MPDTLTPERRAELAAARRAQADEVMKEIARQIAPPLAAASALYAVAIVLEGGDRAR